MTLDIDHVTKRYGPKTAVDDVTLTLPEGAVLGLLGPNGAGKTTTIRMVLDMHRPDGGTITWKGVPSDRIERGRLGYLPEDRGVYDRMKVGEHVAFFGELHGLGRREARGRADRWLTRLGLDARAGDKVAELSKGNQQKVQIASAAVHDPELLVLDEPFSGLDPMNQELLEEVLMELREGGTTLVLSTHDLERVERYCSHVGLIAEGTCVFGGPIAELRERHGELRRTEIALAREDDAEPVAEALRATGASADHDGDRVTVAGVQSLDDVLRTLVRADVPVRDLVAREPSVRDMFLREVAA